MSLWVSNFNRQFSTIFAIKTVLLSFYDANLSANFRADKLLATDNYACDFSPSRRWKALRGKVKRAKAACLLRRHGYCRADIRWPVCYRCWMKSTDVVDKYGICLQQNRISTHSFPSIIYFPLDISNSNLPTLLDFLPHHPPGFFPFHDPFPSQTPLIGHCSITSLSVVTSFDDVYGREKWSKRCLIKCTKIIVSRLDADVCLQILWYRSFGASNFALYIKKNGYIIFLIRNESNYKHFPSLLYRTGWKWWILSPSLPCCTFIYRSRSRSGQKQLERDFQVGPSTLGKRVDQCFVISMTGCYHPLDMQILPDIE